MPNQVLVRFKQTPGAAAAAAAQADRPLPGLQLQRLVGKHQATQVPAPAKPGGAAAAAAANHTLPADAVMLFSITDGTTVPAKLAQLRANQGERGAEQRRGDAGVGTCCACHKQGLWRVRRNTQPLCCPVSIAAVDKAEPNYIYRLMREPNDPYWSSNNGELNNRRQQDQRCCVARHHTLLACCTCMVPGPPCRAAPHACRDVAPPQGVC